MEQWLEASRALLGQWWLPHVLLLLGGALAASFLLRLALGVVRRGTQRTSTILDDVVLHSVARPLQLLVWFIALALAGQLLLGDSHYAAWLPKIRQAGILLILGWTLLLLVRNYSDGARQRAREREEDFDEDLHVAGARVLQATVIVLIGVGLLQTFGVSIMGILTFGGVGGLVVGFAAKDMLENFFGGLMLHMDRPFRTGDWIRSPDRNIEGTVERIGWRQTRIRTHSRNALYIPNGVFLTIVIENPGRMSHRMIKEIIGLRYDDLGKMRDILAEVQELLEKTEEIDRDMPVLARFDAFSESSVDFYIQCYTRTVNRQLYSEVKQNLLLGVADIVARHGAEIAFPTRTVYVQSSAD